MIDEMIFGAEIDAECQDEECLKILNRMNKAKMSKSEDSDFHDLDRTIIDVRKSAD
jgi:hypothetical protein